MDNNELETEIKISKFKTAVIIILVIILIGLCTYIVLNENVKNNNDISVNEILTIITK